MNYYCKSKINKTSVAALAAMSVTVTHNDTFFVYGLQAYRTERAISEDVPSPSCLGSMASKATTVFKNISKL